MKLKNVINKHKSNKITENSNTVRHLNNGTDHRHSKSCCDQSSPARRTMTRDFENVINSGIITTNVCSKFENNPSSASWVIAVHTIYSIGRRKRVSNRPNSKFLNFIKNWTYVKQLNTHPSDMGDMINAPF